MKKSSLEKLLQVHSELYDTEKKELIKDVIVEECGEDGLTVQNSDLPPFTTTANNKINIKEEKDV